MIQSVLLTREENPLRVAVKKQTTRGIEKRRNLGSALFTERYTIKKALHLRYKAFLFCVEDNGVELSEKKIDTQHLQRSKDFILTELLTRIVAANPI